MSSDVSRSPGKIYRPVLKIPYQIDYADRRLHLFTHIIPCLPETSRCHGNTVDLHTLEKLNIPVPFDPDKIAPFQQSRNKKTAASKSIVQHNAARRRICPDKIPSEGDRFLGRMDNIPLAFSSFEIYDVRRIPFPVTTYTDRTKIPVTSALLTFPDTFVIRYSSNA